MKAVVTLVNGSEVEIEGSSVEALHQFFSQRKGTYKTPKLAWVSADGIALNFDHVMFVKFIGESEEG